MSDTQVEGYVSALGQQFYAASPDRKMKLLAEWSNYLPPNIIQGIRYHAAQLDNRNQENLDFLSSTEQRNLNSPLEPVQFNAITNQYQKFNGLR